MPFQRDNTQNVTFHGHGAIKFINLLIIMSILVACTVEVGFAAHGILKPEDLPRGSRVVRKHKPDHHNMHELPKSKKHKKKPLKCVYETNTTRVEFECRHPMQCCESRCCQQPTLGHSKSYKWFLWVIIIVLLFCIFVALVGFGIYHWSKYHQNQVRTWIETPTSLSRRTLRIEGVRMVAPPSYATCMSAHHPRAPPTPPPVPRPEPTTSQVEPLPRIEPPPAYVDVINEENNQENMLPPQISEPPMCQPPNACNLTPTLHRRSL